MSAEVYEITVELRWWVVPYLRTLGFLACMFDVEPDIEKIGAFVMNYGMRIR